MKKKDVRIGCRYTAKVSGDMVPITITDRHCFGGWEARNEVTGRAIRIKTAGRLRRHSKGCPACQKAGNRVKLHRAWIQHMPDLGGWRQCAGNRDPLKAEADCPCGIHERHTHCPGCGGVRVIGDWDAPPIATYTIQLPKGMRL